MSDYRGILDCKGVGLERFQCFGFHTVTCTVNYTNCEYLLCNASYPNNWCIVYIPVLAAAYTSIYLNCCVYFIISHDHVCY